MPFEAFEGVLFHVSLTINMKGIVLLRLPMRKLRHWETGICPRSPGCQSACSALHQRDLHVPGALACCFQPGWLMGISDRKWREKEERSSLCLLCCSPAASPSVASCALCLQLMPNTCPDLVTPPPPVSLWWFLPAVANLWFLTIPFIASQFSYHLGIQFLILHFLCWKT